jgi:Insertion element 4 transposase N-terminal/Transposase DDE domain
LSDKLEVPVQLKELSLTSPKISPEEVLQAIALAIPSETIASAIESTQSERQRNRKLPTHLVVALIIAMSLWSKDSIEDVLENLVHGLSSQWVRLSQRWKKPSKSSISEARQQVGPQVMSQLFHLVARPLGTEQTPGAFLNGLRLMAVDGTAFDLPDTDANARVFGYPGTRAGTEASFPKARLVLLVEAGTHLITDALLSPYRIGERRKALKLLRSVGPGMLLMWDRRLHSFKMVKATRDRGSHFLGRVPKNVEFEVVQTFEDGSFLSWIAPDRKSKKKGAERIPIRVIEYTITEKGVEQTYRLITDLMDIIAFGALLLAQQYHQRWEVENTLDEFKTHLNGRKTPIRSKYPRGVVQEIYGWLLGHWAIRSLMFQAAKQQGLAPLRLGFTGTLRVVRRAMAQFQQSTPEEIPLF